MENVLSTINKSLFIFAALSNHKGKTFLHFDIN